MNKPKIFLKIGKTIGKSNPKVLTAVGLLGMAAACVGVALETPKALDEIKSLKREHAETGEPIKKTDYIKAVAPKYVRPALIFTAAGICIIESDSIQRHRELAAIAVADICQESRKLYEQKVVENVGEEVAADILEAVDKEVISKEPEDNKIVETGNGEYLCYDAFAGRYFRSDKTHIDEAINRLNFRIMNDNFTSLNDLYEEFNLEPTEAGDILGWHSDFGLIEARYSSQVAWNGEPCLVLHYNISPAQGYDDYHTYYSRTL